MLNFRRKPLAAPASIDQELVQIFIQTDIIFPRIAQEHSQFAERLAAERVS